MFFQEFYIEVFFRQRWSDPRLNYNNTNGMDFTVLSLNTIMLESIWYPDTYILNGKKSKSHSITMPNRLFRIFPNGDILYTQRWAISFFLAPRSSQLTDTDAQTPMLHAILFALFHISNRIYTACTIVGFKLCNMDWHWLNINSIPDRFVACSIHTRPDAFTHSRRDFFQQRFNFNENYEISNA